MCSLMPLPPLLVLAGPWDAPLQWSLFVGVVLLVAILSSFAIFMQFVFRSPLYIPTISAVRFGLHGMSTWLLLCDLALSLLVLWPAHDRLEAWYVSEHACVLALNCDPTTFFSAYGAASQTLTPWFYIAALTGMIIATLGIAGGILGIVGIITRSARRVAPHYPA